MYISKILSAVIGLILNKILPNMSENKNEFDALGEKNFAMITSVLMKACNRVGKAGLEVFFKVHDSVEC
ncbi:MAG: hypothetical protein GX612_02685 [Bacteroidales bacterium]|nr:hypothetical protein [Bacteroidales bacterium]